MIEPDHRAPRRFRDGVVVDERGAGAAIGASRSASCAGFTICAWPALKPISLACAPFLPAPFVGDGGWPSDEFELTSELGARLPSGVRVHVFHGLQDETAPPSHVDLYALAIPQAQTYQMPGRDHQLNNDLSEVAEAIRSNRPKPVTHT